MSYYIEKLRKNAHQIALQHVIQRKRTSAKQTINQLTDDMDFLKQFAHELAKKPARCEQLAETWLFENIEFLEEQSFHASISFTDDFVKRLPTLSSGTLRIQALIEQYLSATDGVINDDSLASFIAAYQEVSALTIAEVRAIPALFRLCLIHRFSEIMQEIRSRKEICHQVEIFMKTIDPEKLSADRLSRALTQAGHDTMLSGPWIVHLISHLREYADDTKTIYKWLSCRFQHHGDLHKIVSYEHGLQASYQMIAGNLITSLRKNERRSWEELFSKLCISDQTLSNEPTAVYPLMDTDSKNQLLAQIEIIAERLKVAENLVAKQAVSLANDEVKAELGKNTTKEHYSRQTFVAYYLFEKKGVQALIQSLKTCCKPKEPKLTGILPNSAASYFSYLISLFVIFLALFTGGLSFFQSYHALAWIAILFTAGLLASEWAVYLLHTSIEITIKPQPLLRLNFADTLPKEAATMVVIPVIWSETTEVDEMIDRLELHHLSSRDENIYYALLADFIDHTEHELSTKDTEMLQYAYQKIAELNKQYDKKEGVYFHLFQRKRLWNDHEQVYMGWERKRGKLVEFTELLKGKKDTSFHHFFNDQITELLPDYLQQIKYMITLDADTELPKGNAHRMIATMHLPYNRPRMNEEKTNVISGYAMLQPRVGISLESAQQSKLTASWVEAGVDPYAFATADPYQDAVGHGIFTGKGIFDVDSFYQILSTRIPDNQILSHDLLEGAMLRTGFLSDIEVIDDHPGKFSAYQKRMHRWVRGDWQLLPWLFGKTRNRKQVLQKVDMPAICRWQMIDNLRRSLLPFGYYLTLLFAMIITPSYLVSGWLLLITFTYSLSLIKQIAAVGSTWVQRVKSSAIQVLLNFLILPFQSAVLIHAIGISLYRVLISKKHLLEWTSSSHIEKLHRRTTQPVLEGMAGGYSLILIFGLVSLQYSGILFLFGLGLSLFWASAPFIMRVLDQPIDRKQISLSADDRQFLTKLAEDTWQFYDDFATAETNWLPPDNVQIEPNKGVAPRTSPTNIGYLLTSIIVAEKLQMITEEQLIEKIDKVLTTIESMVKWHGHLYNWYDTTNLEPLYPKYVSTVDSGNFIASLIAVKQGLDVLRIQQKDQSLKDGHHELMVRIEAIMTATDFRQLYNSKSKLFVLGYNDVTKRHDDILYDLLASEARQTSFVAIALGQVPVNHWFTLGRSTKKQGKHMSLLSWSGTMFEYLMPWQLMKTLPGTVWDSTYKGIVQKQIDYADERDVPFGISESGFYAFDYQMNYQYYAFGVPSTGFKKGNEENLVIAPYAAIMALPFALTDSLEALTQMERLGARGQYGFYEALDFTKKRMPKNRHYMLVKSFMAHHQGMSLLTIANLLVPDLMIALFHRDKRVRSVELLLKERIPTKVSVIHEAAAEEPQTVAEKPTFNYKRRFDKVSGPIDLNIHSNGRFTSLVNTRGNGLVKFDDIAVTRWREGYLQDHWGQFFYIRDIATNEVLTPTAHDSEHAPQKIATQFSLGYSSFYQTFKQLKTNLEICVSPEINAEFRKITITNHGEQNYELEVTSFIELAMAPQKTDEAHPAFSKLFVETDYDSEADCLLARKRPRHDDEKSIWAYHRLIDYDNLDAVPNSRSGYETDRHAFIGRNGQLTSPKGLFEPLKKSVGAVTDPAFIMRRSIHLEPGESKTVTLLTGIADSREQALHDALTFTQPEQVEHAFQMSWTRGQIELRHFRLSQQEISSFAQLAARVLYANDYSHERKQAIMNNQLSQKDLWSIGISGDQPIVLIRVSDLASIHFVKKMITCHEYLKNVGIHFSFVFLNESEEGYQQDIQEALTRVVEEGIDGEQSNLGRIHVIKEKVITADLKNLLYALSRLVLRADGASLRAQLQIDGKTITAKTGAESSDAEETMAASATDAPKPALIRNFFKPSSHQGQTFAFEAGKENFIYDEKILSDHSMDPTSETDLQANQIQENGKASESIDPDQASKQNTEHSFTQALNFFNGYGGFSEDGAEYHLHLHKHNALPAPWINVLSNPNFGTITSEKFSGYSWWRNSRECKLTPWSNDKSLDTPGECCYLKNEQTGQIWHIGDISNHADAGTQVTYGKGYSTYMQKNQGLAQEMTVFVPNEDPVKVIRLQLRNETDIAQQISATYYAKWVIGVAPAGNKSFIVTAWDEDSQTILARNHFQDVFRDATAFLSIAANTDDDISWTGANFIGEGGDISEPESLKQTSLLEEAGANQDACGAIQTKFQLAANEETTIYFLLGCEDSPDKVKELVEKYSSEQCETALTETKDFWQQLSEQITVSTPSTEMNFLLNHWLLYQTLACRMWARTAFYQAGGAYGYRDQLQDSLALLHVRPDLTRAQILLHAAHQYVEGDVQHWWHEETEFGIRTRFSDDLHWLPFAVIRYIEHTGDHSILDEVAPYLTSKPLEEDEHERYEPTVLSGDSGTIYEHCVRALERGLQFGEHGLPLIGIGDWNDGMSHIGAKGHGESVWLGWFLGGILRQFSTICESVGDSERANRYRAASLKLAANLDQHAWDGDWYMRAFHDGGFWIGTKEGDECRIDAIAQSWSVLSELGSAEKITRAMESLDEKLVDRDLRLVKILTPGFDQSEPSPGYIQGYPPGIRENGGQYSHGVIWSILAWVKLGRGDKAFELFNLMNPINHGKNQADVNIYRGEPYAMAADVYTAKPHEGQAGWTWYTGASGWMYQAGIEGIIGIKRRRDKLHIKPCIPTDWPGFELKYRFGNTTYHFVVKNVRQACISIQLDGVDLTSPDSNGSLGPAIELVDDGQIHHVVVSV